MFEQSLVEARGLAARPWTLAASLTGQMALISAAILFPLIHPEMLQRVSVLIPVTAPHSYRPTTPQRSDVARMVAAPPRVFDHGVFAPSRVPDRVVTVLDEPGPELAGVTSGSADGVVGAPDWLGNVSSVIDTVSKRPQVTQPAASPVVRQLPKPAATTAPIKTGGDVQAALLTYGPKPAYPPLCKQARIQGTVHLAAVIGRDGRVIDLRARDGHPLLAGAAVEAVKHWTYRPTLLNGEPVEVVTEITVAFTLQ